MKLGGDSFCGGSSPESLLPEIEESTFLAARGADDRGVSDYDRIVSTGESLVTRRPMGSLEAALLEIMWTSSEPLKPGEVLEQLDIEPEVTYSTVLTILRRLWKKGLITRERAGKAYRYMPVLTREEQVAETMAAALAAASDPSAALGHFVTHLSAEDIGLLQKLLGKQR
jgi:predicted transcriptional regulator